MAVRRSLSTNTGQDEAESARGAECLGQCWRWSPVITFNLGFHTTLAVSYNDGSYHTLSFRHTHTLTFPRKMLSDKLLDKSDFNVDRETGVRL